MAFGVGVNTGKADGGKIKGRQEAVACGCWFTSQGNTLPKYIKYQDEEGMSRGISDIEVLYSQKQNYCGIPMVEYVCRGVTQGMRRGFRLFFHLEECIFKIVWE